ncbi:MAG TPA: glycosyltransferase family 39 protein [Chloroflexia bacterium]|nr:glycosyltransferase family 39 protein [Chloroflexia bacterium]
MNQPRISTRSAINNGAEGAQPRRYVGRSGAGLARSTAGAVPIPFPQDAKKAGRTASAVRRVRAAAVPWSFRLALAVSLVVLVFLSFRTFGLFTGPVGSAPGVESTYAASVNVLTGRVASPLDPVRLLPAPAPWYGAAPALPTASLPLFVWATAALGGVFGESVLVGRILAMLAALAAGLVLFALVRRTAGARAAIYAMLFYSVAPLSVVLGQQYSSASLIMAMQALALLMLFKWRVTVTPQNAQGSSASFVWAVAVGVVYALLDPGAIYLALPAAYLIIVPAGGATVDTGPLSIRTIRRRTTESLKVAEMWQKTPNRGRFFAYAGALAAGSLIWWAITQASTGGLWLGAQDGGGGVAGAMGALLNGSSYVEIMGLLVERLLTLAGLLLLAAGILHGARPPVPLLFHTWLVGGLIHVLFDASRLPTHDDVLLPLILPACALAGIGAAWAGAMPARLYVAITEQAHERDSDYAISPHTAWLLDLPEEKIAHKHQRPQAQLALGRSVAERAQTQSMRWRRAWWLTVGHVAVLSILAFVVLGGAKTTLARMQPNDRAQEIAAIGQDVAKVIPEGDRLVVAGPNAPELFYFSGRTGWALSADDFSLAQVETLHRQGAAYLLSVDQDWLGKHPDYRGLITTYAVAKLARNYILFDLNAKPAGNERSYFLESGHTLGGEFRTFWQNNGGVARLGYPISEELVEPSPLDGVERKVQYFERAVLEYHPKFVGTTNAVMLAAVGSWVTKDRNFPKAQPVENTSDLWYFAETGHIVKEAFLRYWQSQGGLATFGYPISEELPEISNADGKVYTVQYFERARFEWHPTFAGTPEEVQLGLIGKQALEMPQK